MKILTTGVISAGLLISLASTSMAYGPRHHRYSQSPSAIAERQRHARTFDPTQYYEHQLNKIPFCTQTWWDQYDREHGGNRR
jgi:hypothetical protein